MTAAKLLSKPCDFNGDDESYMWFQGDLIVYVVRVIIRNQPRWPVFSAITPSESMFLLPCPLRTKLKTNNHVATSDTQTRSRRSFSKRGSSQTKVLTTVNQASALPSWMPSWKKWRRSATLTQTLLLFWVLARQNIGCWLIRTLQQRLQHQVQRQQP